MNFREVTSFSDAAAAVAESAQSRAMERSLDISRSDWGRPQPTKLAMSASEGLLNALSEFIRVVRRFKWVMLAILISVTAIGAARTMMATRLYTASVRLEIDSAVAKVVQKGEVTPVEGRDFEFLRTQYELLQSRSLAQRTVATLKLADDPEFNRPAAPTMFERLTGLFSKPAPQTPAQRANIERGVTGLIVANRVVRPVPGSRLVDISYTDSVPARAQAITMGLANEFIASSRDKRFQANAYAKSFLEDQVQQLQARLQNSEQALIDFGQKEKIVGATDKSSIAESNLAAANTALGNLVSDRIKNEQQFKQVENVDAASLPQFLSNKVIEGLRDKRNALFTDYQEKSQTLRADYPAMVQLASKIKETDRQISNEIRVIKNSLKGAYEASLKQEEQMKARIEGLRADVLDLQKRSIQFNILKREADSNRTLYEDLLQRCKEVDVAGGIGASNVFIVDRAETPTSPSSPNVTTNIALSILLGALAAVIGAFILERLDNTVTKLEDFERLTGLTTLGVVPNVAEGRTIDEEMKDVRSRTWEAYRTLCTSLQFVSDGGLPKSLFFTSSKPSEGKSTSSIAVARHFGNLGLRVLLIDCDLRKPSLHKKLGLENSRGLTNYLTGASTPAEALQSTAYGNLSFMSSGPLPPNASELLGSPRFTLLMTMAASEFDLVILDGPPVMGLADAHLLSKAAEATVFAAQAGKTPRYAIRSALNRLRAARCNVIGAMLTRYEAKNEAYAYEYGYSYGADSEGGGKGVSSEGKRDLIGDVKALIFRKA